MDKLQSTATTIEFVLYIHIFIYIIYFSILETTSNRKQKHLFYRIPKLFENQSFDLQCHGNFEQNQNTIQ